MLKRASSWNGTVLECADALAPLLHKGRPKYTSKADDPVDEEWMKDNVDQLRVLFDAIPAGNGTYSMFVKATLKLMSDNKYGNLGLLSYDNGRGMSNIVAYALGIQPLRDA